MREIIGVAHSGKLVQDAIINYLASQHPNLESLMLEVPENWEDDVAGCLMNPFFIDIGDELANYDIDVIAGDRKYWDIYGGYNKVLKKGQPLLDAPMPKSFQDSLRLESKLVAFKLWGNTKRNLGYFTGKTVTQRNQDMAEVAMQYDPDVVVVGMEHASYLKKKVFPEVKLVFITEKYSLTYAALYTILQLSTPDQIYEVRT